MAKAAGPRLHEKVVELGMGIALPQPVEIEPGLNLKPTLRELPRRLPIEAFCSGRLNRLRYRSGSRLRLGAL
jgi:hypothetical protein